jgi:hypothetical protein
MLCLLLFGSRLTDLFHYLYEGKNSTRATASEFLLRAYFTN